MLVTEEVIKTLHDKYGLVQGSYKIFSRVGAEQDDGEVVCELQMRKIQFMAVPNKKLFRMDKPYFVYVPKSMSVPDL